MAPKQIEASDDKLDHLFCYEFLENINFISSYVTKHKSFKFSTMLGIGAIGSLNG
jgi:hypothetical protein